MAFLTGNPCALMVRMVELCAVYPYVEFLDFFSVKLSNGAFTLKSISVAEILEGNS